jgi:hypothetical protein
MKRKLEHHFKIFGNGLWVRDYALTNAEVREMKALSSGLNVSLEQIVFDDDHMSKLGLKSWSELKVGHSLIWSTVCERSKMEVTCASKRLLKSETLDLLNANYLFPLYELKENNFINQLRPNTLFFGEVLTGQVFRGRFVCEKFNASKLSFSVLPFLNNVNISKVYYDNEELVSTSDQFITRSFFAFFKC